MEIKKTHKGKSANQILKNAKVCETQAGGFEIFVNDCVGYGAIAVLTDNDTVVLENYDGEPFAMHLGKKALEKMQGLTQETESLYLKKHNL